jgi:serine/threonine protein kinase
LTSKLDGWVGTTIDGGRYRILGRIGAGSMGHVFRAFDHRLQTEVVIKFPIAADQGMAMPNLLERFGREARSLVRLSHPHIVKVLDVGSLDGNPYVVMQYLTGGSLKDRLDSGPKGQACPMPPSSLRDWLPEVARALDFIHSQGHIHRDVKPANILFDGHGNAFLGDFGIVKALSPDDEDASKRNSLTAPGFLLGTPSYVAPEIVMGGVPDGRADQYSLALTVHEVMSGRNFITGPSPSATIVNQTNLDPPPLTDLVPEIPSRLSQAVRRALAKERGDRFASCAALAQEILADLPEPSGPRAVPSTYTLLGCIPCPLCQAPIAADSRYHGEEVRCVKCGQIFIVATEGQNVRLLAREVRANPPRQTGPKLPIESSHTEFSVSETPVDWTVEPLEPGRASTATMFFSELSPAQRLGLRTIAPTASQGDSSSAHFSTEFSFSEATGPNSGRGLNAQNDGSADLSSVEFSFREHAAPTAVGGTVKRHSSRKHPNPSRVTVVSPFLRREWGASPYFFSRA